jgi:hypothetical protein
MNPNGGMANDRLGGQPHHLLHRGLLAESAFGGKADIVPIKILSIASISHERA